MSSRGSPTCASARRAAVTWLIVAFSPRTSSTRSRIALSKPMSLLVSSLTLTTWASTSANASGLSVAPRSSRGRSTGSTQTSGSSPPLRASSIRSLAIAPSDRSSTVRWPPL